MLLSVTQPECTAEELYTLYQPLVVHLSVHNPYSQATQFINRMNQTRYQKHHLAGNAIPTGYSHAMHAHMLLYVSGINYKLYNLNSNYIRSIWHNSAADFFTFWKISTANLRILWRHLPI